MWWRNPIRIAAVIALGALNAACFQPLYASRSVAGGTPLGTQLAQVQVEHIDAAFVLTELATGKAVMRGSTVARVSSDYPGQQQRFARARARLDAEARAAKVIAENVRTRVASFFVAGT